MMTTQQLANYLDCEHDYLRDKTNPNHVSFNSLFANAVCMASGRVNTQHLIHYLGTCGTRYRVHEEKAAHLFGLSLDRLHKEDSVQKDFLGCYPIEEIELYAPSFIGSYAPSNYVIADQFEPSGLLYGIVVDQHDNKLGLAPVDFYGTFESLLSRPVTEWRGEVGELGTIGDRCDNDVEILRRTLIDKQVRKKLLSASVEVLVSADSQRLSIRLIGPARFYAETGSIPFFPDIYEHSDI